MRTAHGLGDDLVWSRGFFGEHLIAERSQSAQLISFLPFDRKEAALFGLAAERLSCSQKPLLLTIGAASSHRCQGFANLCRIFGATLALHETSDLFCSKFLYELQLNGGIAPGTLELIPLKLFSSPTKSQSKTPLADYLKKRQWKFDFPYFEKMRQRSQLTSIDALGKCDFVWIESGSESPELACSLLPQLRPSTPILLRIDAKSVEKCKRDLLSSQCAKYHRAPHTLSDGKQRSWQELMAYHNTLWLAIV